MKILLHPTYFPSIGTFAVMAQREVVWEVHDNFQKQTYRNRCYICTDQGRHRMNIPIKHVGGNEGRQQYAQVSMDNSSAWKKIHWRTLQTAYRTSPYFEFYEDALEPIFTAKAPDTLLEFNFYILEVLSECLGLTMGTETTENYQKTYDKFCDARFMVDAKRPFTMQQPKYTQVFEEKHGFVENLSVLDLLFNEGPNTITYLKSIPLSYLEC
ncbi:MAG: WbqC family protein [Bacteroidota bacterium]